jgi:hypothetical protein
LDSIKPAFESLDDIQKQADQAVKQSRAQGAQGRANKLQRCVSHAGQNTDALQRCVQRYAP